MAYYQKEIKAGKLIEIERYYAPRLGYKGERNPKSQKSNEQMVKENDRQAARKLAWLIAGNFKEGDYHMVLDYRKEEKLDNFEVMIKQADSFLAKLKRRYAKLGVELKYIHVVEKGSKGAMHHHLVLNNALALNEIQKCWPHGRVHINLLDDSGDYHKLAEYLIKYTSGQLHEGNLKQRYRRSRNLVMPEIKKKVVPLSKFGKEPKRKGYVLIDSWEGHTKTDYPYQIFRYVKTERSKE